MLKEAIYYPSLRTKVSDRMTVRIPLPTHPHPDPATLSPEAVLDALHKMNAICDKIGHVVTRYRLIIDEMLPLGDAIPDLADAHDEVKHGYVMARSLWSAIAIGRDDNLSTIETKLLGSGPDARYHWYGSYTRDANGIRTPMTRLFTTLREAERDARKDKTRYAWYGTKAYAWTINGNIAEHVGYFTEPEDAEHYKPVRGIVELVEIHRDEFGKRDRGTWLDTREVE